uniref:Uncharacterized protein n=1 Tax=Trypanosoma congolense (strain IL3000) TaxID=1068625 RepID=G0V0V7_TRYCI|nr:hypothetical protein, unlikely [Trypanosoma congolense IL3000]
MSLKDCGVVAQWEGEWPWLKQRVTVGREYAWMVGSIVGPALNVAGHVATAKHYAEQADRFVAVPVSAVGETLRTKQWILPVMGIGAVSTFVTVKSASMGIRRSMRNGGIAAAALTALLFPREITTWIDTALPFRVADTGSSDEDD